LKFTTKKFGICYVKIFLFLAKDVKNKLDIKESTEKGVFIKDLSINTAKTHEELMDYMNLGNKNRSVG
jgi:hypothetical protein